MKKILRRLVTAWRVLIGKRYWVFTLSNGEYLEDLSSGWTTHEAREIVKAIHHKAFKAEQQNAVNKAKQIIDEGRNSV